MTLSPLPLLMIEAPVRAALLEDLGRAGDLTTDAIVPAALAGRDGAGGAPARRRGRARRRRACLPPGRSGDRGPDRAARRQPASKPGDRIAIVAGPARGMLTAERVALNFLGHLSGVASATATLVEAVRGHKARICCTRKTMPGLRALQKYAVRAGGGVNHRFGLDDAVLIKDNHVAAAGGVGSRDPRARARASAIWSRSRSRSTGWTSSTRRFSEKADAVLLDNMGPETLAEAVRRIAGRAIAEASGRITPATAPAIAASGVDLISAGWLTHSAQVLDIGLDWRHASTRAERSAA